MKSSPSHLNNTAVSILLLFLLMSVFCCLCDTRGHIPANCYLNEVRSASVIKRNPCDQKNACCDEGKENAQIGIRTGDAGNKKQRTEPEEDAVTSGTLSETRRLLDEVVRGGEAARPVPPVNADAPVRLRWRTGLRPSWDGTREWGRGPDLGAMSQAE
eukprot:TRINITY_DN4286_c0_g1_i2.p1 TRINITY_DN4286_c0_g1~~TRINITY_DN4286_c0_g1_i2.p1  ORF type:complete len:158 (-),score=10.00 TRINITY_DN4286_c0_g1_i2:174-647(-)